MIADLFLAIKLFKAHTGSITVPAGMSLYQGHIAIPYPEYNGNKDDMLEFYTQWANSNDIDKSKLNNVYHELIKTIIYE